MGMGTCMFQQNLECEEEDLRCVCWEGVYDEGRAFMIVICEQTRNGRQADKHAI
jgi:hypothetical protein